MNDKIAEGGVLSAFFYGYALTQIVAGAPRTASGGNVLLFGVVAWSLARSSPRRGGGGHGAAAAGARLNAGRGRGRGVPRGARAHREARPQLERRTTAVATVTAASYAGAAFAFGATPPPRRSPAAGRRRSTPPGAAALLWVALVVP